MAHNFYQFDPTKNNMMSDAGYFNSNYRKNGAQAGVAPAPVHNKLYYQATTFITAFAEMMNTKGYELNDTSLSTLAAELANVVTNADLSPYALQSQLTGYIAKASVIIKTTTGSILPAEFYKTIEANSSSAIQLTLPLFSDVTNGAWVKIKNINTGVLTLNATIDGETNPVLSQWDEIVVYSDGSALRGKVVSTSSSEDWDASLTQTGFQKYPSGLMEQWGFYPNEISLPNEPFSHIPPIRITFSEPFLAVFNASATGCNDDEDLFREPFILCKELTTTYVDFHVNRPNQTYLGKGPTGFYWRVLGKWK